jgi:hypothetical protein
MGDHHGDLAAASKSVILIVLFGNENHEKGIVSPIALERCDRTVELAKEYPESFILPTGAFGDFNRSVWPHGTLLRKELKNLGVSPERILPFTNSSGTLEDVLFARKVAVDMKASKVIFVTSSFHMPRVEYICRRIFPDFPCDFECAHEKDDHSDRAPGEGKKLNELKAEWVDVPLYRDPPRGNRFPLPIYVNAAKEQKHYDFLSYLFVSAIFLAFAFPYTVDPAKLRFCTWPLFLLSTLAILLLYTMYYRAAHTARTARTVMRNIEAQYGQPGFSFNHRRQRFPVPLKSFFAALLAVLAGGMALTQVVVAGSLTRRLLWTCALSFGIFSNRNRLRAARSQVKAFGQHIDNLFADLQRCCCRR